MNEIKTFAAILIMIVFTAISIYMILDDDEQELTNKNIQAVVCFGTTGDFIKEATVSYNESAVQTEENFEKTEIKAETETTTSLFEYFEYEDEMEFGNEYVEFPLNLNAASFEELIQLPGIGEITAENIIAYREANGGFRNREELLEVNGIGKIRYQQIYDLVYLDVEYYDSTEETNPPETDYENTQKTDWIPVIVNVNTASAEEFAYLPGVDMELASKIIALRDEIGGYKNILELLYVEGMTVELYRSIDEYLVC